MTEQLDSLWQWCLEAMQIRAVLLIFVVLGVGQLIGRIGLGSFSLGPVAGVLFAGIFFGHFGLRITPDAQALGFALFIFSVGYQAGPKFFSAVRADGLKYFALALVVATSSVLITLAAARVLDADPGVSAGLLAGGLTSSPTLAAAQEAVREGTVPIPEGWDRETVIDNVATAYAITYIFGLTGLISIIKLMPRLLGIDLEAECRRLEHHGAATIAPANITTRCYRVASEDFAALTLHELHARFSERVPVLRVLRQGETVKLGPQDHLQIGDVVEIIGPRKVFTRDIGRIGPEIPPDWNIEQATDTAQIVVTNQAVLGRSLGELNIPQSFGVLIAQITQMGVPVPHSYDHIVQKGDILKVVGPAGKIDLFGAYLGHIERQIHETDMVTFAFGIAAGVVLGMLSVAAGGLQLGLGSAGGLLAAGLIIGYLRSVRPTFGHLPEGARWLLMEFGLLLFMAAIGLRAGGDIIATVASSGPALVVAGIMVTTVPIFLAYLFGSRVLRLSPPILLGALTGAMTSGASLSVVTSTAKSAIPAIGYAGTYAFGNVLLMVAGPLVLLLS